jgi:hypothetical protein
MDTTLWIIASALSLLSAASGAAKLARPRQKLIDGGYAWAEDFSDLAVKNIGLFEVLGGLGLILPGLLGIATVLVPVAGTGLAVLMTAATATHLRRGETKQAAVPTVLVLLAAFVAAMRFGAYGL